MRPTLRLLLSHPAHFISLGFGSGLAAKAPGTFGSLAAWALFALAEAGGLRALGVLPLLAVLTLAFFLGALCIARTGQALGEVDHGGIVWDEFVAVWLVLLFTPAGWLWQAVAVALFRVFDIAKPWPIRQADRRFKNGLGVMFDDLLAAFYTLLCVLLLARFCA